MRKNYNTAVIITVIALVLGGAIFLFNGGAKFLGGSNTPGKIDQQTQPVKAPDTGYNEIGVVTFDGKSFEPATISFKFDESLASAATSPMSSQWIKIVNSSQEVIKVYSNPHPTHTDNPDLNMGVISPGEFKIAQITKKGIWGYHNHLNPSQGGTVVAN